MKKCIPICLALVVALVVWSLNRPVDPVEANCRAFKEAHRELLGITWYRPLEKLYRLASKTNRKPITVKRAMELQAEMAHSREKLVARGYLTEREFMLTNATASSLMSSAWRGKMILRIPKQRIAFCLMSPGSKVNTLRIVAFPEDMPVWEELIHEADVPENK